MLPIRFWARLLGGEISAAGKSFVFDDGRPLTASASSEAYQGYDFVYQQQLQSSSSLTFAPVGGDNRVDASEIHDVPLTGTSNVTGGAVTIAANGVPLATAVVGSDGTWLTDIDLSAFTPGSYSFAASVADADGFTVSAGAIVTVAGSSPALTTRLVDDTGTSATDQITKAATVTGEGDPNAVVSFSVDGVVQTGKATANGSGVYSYTPVGLADGNHTIVASESNAFGTSTASMTFVLDTSAPLVAITSAGGDVTTASQSVSGTVSDAHPGSAVTLYDGTTQIGTAQVIGESDQWQATLTIATDGTHVITAVATDAAGNTGASQAIDITLIGGQPVGKAEDGYIVGGTVAYQNGSGPSTTTDADGNFSLTGGSGPIVLTGGNGAYDSATGLTFNGTLTAPAGSTILSPLTTLVEALLQAHPSESAADAATAVASALGLPGSPDLLSLDAVAGTQSGDVTATAAFKAGSELLDVVTLIAAAGGSAEQAYAAVAADVVTIGGGTTIDLTASATVQAIGEAAGLATATTQGVAAIVSATTTALDATLAAATTPMQVFEDITGASILQQGDAAKILSGLQNPTPDRSKAAADAFAQTVPATLATDIMEAPASNPPCYCRGTRILTDRGQVAVEALAIGDLVVTASGGLRPITWLGHRSIDITRHPDPKEVWPICVSQGAFGPNRPSRGLWLSPGHNIAAEGVLMPASLLVNGVNVVQHKRSAVDYWHVELDSHDIILAEGLEAESYLDTGNRTAFVNGGDFIEAHPTFAPKHWAETCVPLVHEGEAVTRTKALLITRASESGFAVTHKADLHILADGTRIEPMRLDNDRVCFTLPAGCRAILLSSRTFVPAYTCPDSQDLRDLGIDVRRLQIDGEEIALDADLLSGGGWNEPEREGDHVHRWTTGQAPLPAGSRLILLDLNGRGFYWTSHRENVVVRFGQRTGLRLKAEGGTMILSGR